jgi:dienelactone hydrolase
LACLQHLVQQGQGPIVGARILQQVVGASVEGVGFGKQHGHQCIFRRLLSRDLQYRYCRSVPDLLKQASRLFRQDADILRKISTRSLVANHVDYYLFHFLLHQQACAPQPLPHSRLHYAQLCRHTRRRQSFEVLQDQGFATQLRQAGNPEPGASKRLLGNVVGGVEIPRNGHNRGKDGILITIDEAPKGGFVAALGCSHLQRPRANWQRDAQELLMSKNDGLYRIAIALLLLTPAWSQPVLSQSTLAPVGDETFAAMARWFEYVPGTPETHSHELRTTERGRVVKLVFRSAGARPVPALLELPLEAQAPYPVVILIHGISRSKEYWWSFGTTTEGKHKDRLLAEGFAVLGLDLPLHGERAAENGYADPASLFADGFESPLRDLFTNSVIEHQQALDVLWERADIDITRIGVLGYEFGASVAFALAAIDPRIQATVACVPPTVRDPLSMRATQNYAPRVRSPLLMLMAANSRTSSAADAEQLHALLAAPAELKVYTSDDRLPIWYVGDAISWFVTHVQERSR